MTTPEMAFQEFPSIPRLFRKIFVTEKIDGTNAHVHISEEGEVRACSRNRYITCEADNFGFAKWVQKHQEELHDELGPGRHYGEWYGSGIQRGYGLLNGEKRFALFNIYRWWNEVNATAFTAEEVAKQKAPPLCCGVVPILGWNPTFDSTWIGEIAERLLETGSRVGYNFYKPEGVVVYHTAAKQYFKYTLEKNDGHKTR